MSKPGNTAPLWAFDSSTGVPIGKKVGAMLQLHCFPPDHQRKRVNNSTAFSASCSPLPGARIELVTS